MPHKPVEDYYDEKKRRYLDDMRRAAEDMTTGTPFDWEEAGAYKADLPGHAGKRDDDVGPADSAAAPSGWRRRIRRLKRLFGAAS